MRPAHRARAAQAVPGERRSGKVFTPAILGLMVFFILLSLSTSGIINFSVVALMSGYALPFSTANLALTAFLAASAFGVLGGGFVADLTRRHGDVAAAGFAANAVIMLLIATVGFAPPVLIAAMGLAGFLSGMIMPSRDMLVRAAAPPGAMGRAFGIVTMGFSIGGTVGPMLFGWIMDRGAPRWVFGASVVFMVLTVALALIGDRCVCRPPPANGRAAQNRITRRAKTKSSGGQRWRHSATRPKTTSPPRCCSALRRRPDPRLRQIMLGLVKHLHAFVKEVELTEAEWFQAIEILTEAGRMCSDKRQEFILFSDTLGVSMVVDLINHRKPDGATESTVFGPFHRLGAPELEAGGNIAPLDKTGTPTLVSGRVLDLDGKPIAGAVLDVWQTQSSGLYDSQDESLAASCTCAAGSTPTPKAAT